MRSFAAILLTIFLTASFTATAQIRGVSAMSMQRMGGGGMRGGAASGIHIGGAPGSVSATVPPGIHIGTTQFPPFSNRNFRFHHFRRRGFYGYPYYYAYGYGPYGYGYGCDYGNGYGSDYGCDYADYPGYTGYIPGTFETYSPAPYGAYPQQYAPAPNYYVPRNPPPPPPNEPQPESYQPPRNRQNSQEAEFTVLVFRDGHRQEVANYAIMGSTLFVLSGPRARIPMAELDVPATERVNQNRGIEFSVPKAH